MINRGQDSRTTAFGVHAEEELFNIYFNNVRLKKQKLIPNRKLTIVVIRIDLNNELIYSKPCTNCLNIMIKNYIRKVIYSNDDGTMCEERLLSITGIYSSGYRRLKK